MRGFFLGRAVGWAAFLGMLALLAGCAGSTGTTAATTATTATTAAPAAQSATATAEHELANVCQQIATAYNTASIGLANNELTQAEIAALVAAEPVANGLCNSATPPADTSAALTQAQAVLNSVSMAVAGVKQ